MGKGARAAAEGKTHEALPVGSFHSRRDNAKHTAA